MSLSRLFIRPKKSIAGIQLDAVLSESHSADVRVTKNPVELGATISDHAIIEPKKLRIEATITNSPLGSAAIGQLIDTASNLFGSTNSENVTRSSTAYNALIEIMEQRQLIEVQTKLKLYENMMITSMPVIQTKNNSNSVDMVINLEELLITESEFIALPAEFLQAGTIRNQGRPVNDRGRQSVNTLDDNVSKSVAKKIKDWLTND